MIETISWQGKVLAMIVRAEWNPETTSFLTPPDFNLQVGHVVYPAGKEIARHVHLPIGRTTVGTAEVLMVRSGRCEVDIFSEERDLVSTHVLKVGDVLIMAAGGHGFRLLEDTVLFEIKQGPYPGMDEKERF